MNEKELFHAIVDYSSLEINEKDKAHHFFSSVENNDPWFALRKAIIHNHLSILVDHFRSPIQTQHEVEQIQLLTDADYNYERGSSYPDLESRFHRLLPSYSQSQTFFHKRTLLFSSGMAAISTALNFGGHSLIPARKKKLLIFGTYFETKMLIRSLGSSFFPYFCNSWQEFSSQLALDFYDVAYIEPLAWNHKIVKFDESNLQQMLSSLNLKNLRIIIFDTTLSGVSEFDTLKLFKNANTNLNCLIFTISSMIKTNQFGLEFTNAGIMHLFAQKRTFYLSTFEKIIEHLQKLRSTTDQSLSSLSMSILTEPFLSEPVLVSSYTNLIKTSNALFYSIFTESLKESFCTVETSLDPRPELTAPFSLISLKDSEYSKYQALLKKVFLLVKANGLCVDPGTSFGFQKTRIDLIRYNIENDVNYLRVSPGAFVSDHKQLVEIIQEKIGGNT